MIALPVIPEVGRCGACSPYDGHDPQGLIFTPGIIHNYPSRFILKTAYPAPQQHSA